MAVASARAERIDLSHPMERSSSKSASEAASESSSTAALSYSAGTPDRNDPSNSSPNPHEVQSPASLRSEEYRQLFRLPAEEVLVEDFNCAFQENILIQGHMYLFVHYVCFYSNIFGFETKKIIHFHEVTIVRRAKTAGIFPNAIEIFAGGKKYFFASFLSRDEAFKLINDGWLQNNADAKLLTEQQESILESSNQENGVVVIENVKSVECPANESDSTERNSEPPILKDTLPVNVEDDIGSPTFSEQQDNVEQDAEPVLNNDSSSSKTTWTWKQENIDAPKIPEFYTKVAESKFPLKVEDFFSFFLSDDAIDFIDLFRKKCGDKDFRCSSWYPHERFGHARDVSFQHPIKIYFGAKFGSCQEIQKFRVYRNSHLVMETSQEVSDVPYSDYFRVEGLWDVEREADKSKECCILRIYVNVAFSKRTVWKGKIVQNTIEECQEAYTTWINMAHELLKQKNLEQKERGPAASMIQDGEVHTQSEAKTGESSERLVESSDRVSTQQVSDSMDVNQQVGNHLRGNSIDVPSVASWLRESIVRLGSSLKSQNHISVLAVIIFAVILLMQLSIVVLLARPQHIHVSPQADYMNGVGGKSSEAMAWLEKRIHHLKDEMYMVESRLERMRREHALLKAQLKDFEDLSKQR